MPEGYESLPEGSKGFLEGPNRRVSGPIGGPAGDRQIYICTDIQMYICTDIQMEFFSILQDFNPCWGRCPNKGV